MQSQGKFKSSYFRHSCLEKAVMLGYVEEKRGRGQLSARWLNSVTVAISILLGDLKVKVRDMSSCRNSIYVVARSKK